MENTISSLQAETKDVDIISFSSVLKDNDQGYKFFWFQSLLDFVVLEKKDKILFEDLIDRMLAKTWYTVNNYHLKLGPRRYDTPDTKRNQLEYIVHNLYQLGEIPADAKETDIIKIIHAHNALIKNNKENLTINVPYRFLSPFISIQLTESVWRNSSKMISILDEINQTNTLPYTIQKGKNSLTNIVCVDQHWADFFNKYYSVLMDWTLYNEVCFLQRNNPGVPGITDKLFAPQNRKLQDVTRLWKSVLKSTEIIDIYSDVPVNEERYDIDHFVPWSFVASDELWNLVPVKKELNISKSNHLAPWDIYSEKFIQQQYFLNQKIYSDNEVNENFNRCLKNNLNNDWAFNQLYIQDIDYCSFHDVLADNLKPVYDSAKDQGFEIWNNINSQKS
jgi:hypothetical protein